MSKQLKEQVDRQYEEFLANYNQYVEKGNKSASARARKNLNNLQKLTKDLKKQLMEESKK